MVKATDLFKPHAPRIFTMPSGTPFLKMLASTLLTALGDELPEALILLPTRRAARALAGAFIETAGGKATLLPLLRTLADMDENEPPFELGSISGQIPPVINSSERRFIMARLVMQKMHAGGENPDANAGLALAEPVLDVLTDMVMEEIGPEALGKLKDQLELLPQHHQDAAKFIEIIGHHWPEFLHERGLSETMWRRITLLDAAGALWQDNPPTTPVVVAGSTGTLGATARLIRTVSRLPGGCVILPGLDPKIDPEIYQNINEQHPYASLKTLLETLETDPTEVANWPGTKVTEKTRLRRRILSESLRPVDSAFDWPNCIGRIKSHDKTRNPFEPGLDGLSLIEAKTEEEEASVIALVMREALETPGKNCILVTPDPSLARRVRTRLSRWQIKINSSAGEPLEETGHGLFLHLTAAAALDPFDPLALTELVKHPLCTRTQEDFAFWQKLEKSALRGIRPKSTQTIKTRLNDHTVSLDPLENLLEVLKPLTDILNEGPASAAKIATLHVQVMEVLSNGPSSLWSDEAGEKAAAVMEDLICHGDKLPDVASLSYLRLLSTLMRGQVVRPRYGMHERLQILGPLEARMLDADMVILGGLNEGVWPVPPPPHPFLSRNMRKKIGLSVPEKRLGLAAHDFAELACSPNVILTRATRTTEGPTVMSRWLWRLTTLARGALGKEEAKNILGATSHYLDWVRTLEAAPGQPVPAKRPEPRPPVDVRPKKLSVTQISTWVRDPYAIYACKILGLRPLDPLDQPPGMREYGTAVHRAFEQAEKTGVDVFELLVFELGQAGYQDHEFARLKTRLHKMADWYQKWQCTRQQDGWKPVILEEHGEWQLRNFTLNGIPDRIEQKGKDFAIFDFKLGQVPSKKIVRVGFDPQLPLLAAMLRESAFAIAGETLELKYVKPNARDTGQCVQSLIDQSWSAKEYSDKATQALVKLITRFENPEAAYHSQPRAQYVNLFGDYDHLARRKEWMRTSGENTE